MKKWAQDITFYDELSRRADIKNLFKKIKYNNNSRQHAIMKVIK
jgi:hypothetical protein